MENIIYDGKIKSKSKIPKHFIYIRKVLEIKKTKNKQLPGSFLEKIEEF